MGKEVKEGENHRIAGDEARNAIGELEVVAGAGPDDLQLRHIKLSLAPLARQMINALHFGNNHETKKKKKPKIHTRKICSSGSPNLSLRTT